MCYQILCSSVGKNTHFVLLPAKLKMVLRFPVAVKLSSSGFEKGALAIITEDGKTRRVN